MSTPSAQRTSSCLARHVADLCATHEISVRVRRSYGGWASKRSRTICIMPVKTQRTYIVALHEIGHIVGRGRSGTRLEQEAAAWSYVMRHSIIPLSPATYSRMLRYLDSYLLRAAHSRRMTVPPPDNGFWKVYAAVETGARSRSPLPRPES